MGRIDTHVHVASGDTARYPRQPTGVGRDWWRRSGYDVDSVLATLDGAGVPAFVAVQAVGVYGYDNRYVVSAAEAHPGRVSAVVSVDMEEPGAPDEIERLGHRPAVVGVRLFAVRPGSTWVGGSAAPASFEAAAAVGLTVVLTVFSAQIPALRPVIERSPTPAVVFDHCGFPQFADGVVADGDPVLDLAALPHVSLKVSSHVLRSLWGRSGPPGRPAGRAVRCRAPSLGLGLPPERARQLWPARRARRAVIPPSRPGRAVGGLARQRGPAVRTRGGRRVVGMNHPRRPIAGRGNRDG